ncbi:MAG TPA: recombinase family protein [Candidatus Limnocylindria bacterium]
MAGKARIVRAALRRFGLVPKTEARDVLKTLVTASYIRVSSERQGKRYGPASQREDIADAVDTYGLQTPQFEFEDHISAKGEVVRTDFVRMIALARAGLFQLLLMGRVDRFARNEREAWNFLEELIAAGVVVYFCDEDAAAGLDEDWEDSVSEEISMAAAVSRKIGRNVRKARRQQRKRGEFVGCVPDGWRRTPSRGLEFDPERIKLPKRIVALALKNKYSNVEIARKVTEEGFRTRRGGFVNKVYVRDLLLNPILYGAWHRNTEDGRNGPRYAVDEGRCQQLITKKQFQRIGANMHKRARTHLSAKKQHHVYPLKEVLRCGEINPAKNAICGAEFGGHSYTYTVGDEKRSCVSYRHKMQGCSPNPHAKKATFTDKGVVAQLTAVIRRLALPDDALAIVAEYMREQLERADPMREKERIRLKQAIAREHQSYRAGGYGEDPDAAAIERDKAIAPLQAALAALPEPADVRPEQMQVIRDLPRLWVEGDDETRRQLAEELFEAVYLVRPNDGPINPKTGKPRRRGLALITRVVLRPEYAALFALALPAEVTGADLPVVKGDSEGRSCRPSRTALIVDGVAELRAWLAGRGEGPGTEAA